MLKTRRYARSHALLAAGHTRARLRGSGALCGRIAGPGMRRARAARRSGGGRADMLTRRISQYLRPRWTCATRRVLRHRELRFLYPSLAKSGKSWEVPWLFRSHGPLPRNDVFRLGDQMLLVCNSATLMRQNEVVPTGPTDVTRSVSRGAAAVRAALQPSAAHGSDVQRPRGCATPTSPSDDQKATKEGARRPLSAGEGGEGRVSGAASVDRGSVHVRCFALQSESPLPRTGYG